MIGLDLSLHSTGYAVSGEPATTGVIRVRSMGVQRLREIRDRIIDVVDSDEEPRGVVIEGYSYGSSGHLAEIGELGGVVRLALHERGVPMAVVPPSCLKMYAAGKGNASKDEVLEAAIRVWGFAGTGNDQADAYMLMLMGLDAAGVLARPKLLSRHAAKADQALQTVRWPW